MLNSRLLSPQKHAFLFRHRGKERGGGSRPTQAEKGVV